MKLTDEQIAAIRDGTEGVTPGPWASSDWSEDDGPNAFTIGAASNRYRVAETHEGDNPLKDAAHIARCDPDTIRSLATEVLESRAETERLTKERDLARAANERDRTHIIMAVNKLVDAQRSYSWLLDGGRGSYAWDDARYRDEFGHAMKAMDGPIEILRKIGKDRTDCPETQAGVEAARAALGRDAT